MISVVEKALDWVFSRRREVQPWLLLLLILLCMVLLLNLSGLHIPSLQNKSIRKEAPKAGRDINIFCFLCHLPDGGRNRGSLYLFQKPVANIGAF